MRDESEPSVALALYSFSLTHMQEKNKTIIFLVTALVRREGRGLEQNTVLSPGLSPPSCING